MALTAESHGRNPVKGFRPRLLLGMWLVSLAFMVLLARLYTLQIVRGEELASQGERNFIKRTKIPHDRGIIYDRHGRILVDNRPALDCQVTPAFLGKPNAARETLERLGDHLGLTREDIDRVRAQTLKRSRLARFQPIVVKRDLSPAEVEAIEADRSVFLLDGVDIVEGRRRLYRYGSLAAHLLGYVNEIDAPTLEAERGRGNPLNYELGDLTGRDGIERRHEEELRGVDGYDEIVVDAKGRRQHDAYVTQLLGEDRRVEPTPGKNVYLSLDLDLQQAAEAAFQRHGRAGSVVVVDVRTGGILALVSVPEFDPNVASGALGAAEKARLDLDPLKPWLNRPIQGQYAPGSTFKVVTALAALMEKATNVHEQVYCPGYYRMGRHTWRCHKDSGHGYVNLRDAMKLSCDTYFYTMGARIGIDGIAKAGKLLGLGAPTGIALRGERPGIMPDEAYHDRADRATGGYQRGMAINTSIGQGSVLMTPLQLAYLYAAIANDGTVYRPKMVERIETADLRVARRFLEYVGDPYGVLGITAVRLREEVSGEPPAIVRQVEPEVRSKVEVPPTFWGALHEGLFAVTNEPGGTAYYRRSRLVSMAGKTGTAQVVRLGRDRLKPEEMDYFQRDHAWFAAYAPAEAPEISVAVLNEHSGHGGSHAAPIATEVIDAYVTLRQARAARASRPTSGVNP